MASLPKSLSLWRKPLLVGTTGLLLAIALAFALTRWDAAVGKGLVGVDLTTYRTYASRFLETGSQYLPYQLSGGYESRPALAPDELQIGRASCRERV